MTDDIPHPSNVVGSGTSSAYGVTSPEEKKDNDDNLKQLEDGETDFIVENARPSNLKKYTDWPVREIREPHDHDVLYGRGGGTNHHPGNKRYRKMVEDRKIDYVNRKRLDKPLVALEIIREWRGQDPPGRFLKLDEKTGLWFDVGDKKAREKTSQALREKAPQIRQQQEEERGKDDGFFDNEDDEEEETTIKSTRFADGTNLDEPKKPLLARDHSLGREYLDEAMTLDGFSWREPLADEEGSSSDVFRATRVSSFGSQPAMPPPVYPPTRVGSQSSFASIPPSPGGDPYRFPSVGSVGPPPLPHPASYEHNTSGEHHMGYSGWPRYDSWGSIPGGVPPPCPPGYGYPPPHTRSWTQRDHSLASNPLTNASVTQPAYQASFDSRTGTWGHAPPPPPGHYYTPTSQDCSTSHFRSNGSALAASATPYQHNPSTFPHSEPPSPHVGVNGHLSHPDTAAQHHMAPRSSPTPSRQKSPARPQYSPKLAENYNDRFGEQPKSPPYPIDVTVASQWSGKDPQEIALTLSGGSEEHDVFSISPNNSFKNRTVPKPDIVKRATSNQNETIETKPDLQGPSVKRCALNRDNSMASNRLKEEYIPGYFDKEVHMLSANLKHSNIGNINIPKPDPLKTERMSTIDTLDLMVQKVPLTSSSRSNTIDALNLDYDDDDPYYKNYQTNDNSGMEDTFAGLREGLPRPSAITVAQRLTTTDVQDYLNEPIGGDDYNG